MTKSEKHKECKRLLFIATALDVLPADLSGHDALLLQSRVVLALSKAVDEWERMPADVERMPADVVGNHLTDGVGGRCSDKAAAAGAR